MSSVPENVAAEEAAWAEVLHAWGDEDIHRAYLARFPDLEGLAVAGRRYREALAANPDDPVAARFRDEVVKRAMVQGLVSLPHRPPPAERPRTMVRAVLVAMAVGLGAATLWVIGRLPVLVGARP
jgi:hypothetical protein